MSVLREKRKRPIEAGGSGKRLPPEVTGEDEDDFAHLPLGKSY